MRLFRSLIIQLYKYKIWKLREIEVRRIIMSVFGSRLEIAIELEKLSEERLIGTNF